MMMRHNAYVVLMIIIFVAFSSCNYNKRNTGSDNNPTTIFPKGDTITNNNFTGTAFVQMLVESDSIYNMQIGNVTFQPGARSHWHSHPGGQILLITSGKGYYQEKEKPKRIIRAGDVIKCPPNITHWHGASQDSGVSHIAIGPNMHKGSVTWLAAVTDEEYGRILRQ